MRPMRGVIFLGPESVAVADVPDPRIEDPRDVIVRVERSAICGSDLHVYHGREVGLDPRTILGHEFVGEVVEAGADVERFPAGTRVVSPFSTSCGACFFCRRGLTSRCEHGALFGWVQDGRGLQGAQAELVRVSLADTTLVRVPPDLPGEEALLAGDVLATGRHCAARGGVRPGQVVVVLGCGPVGLAAVLAAVEEAPERVLAIDRVPARLELARAYGAEAVDFSTENPLSLVRAATEGRGADVVLEVVGSPQATRLAVDLVRNGGTISAAGVHTERHFAFSPTEAYDKNLTYTAGRCPARVYTERVLEDVAARRHDLSAMISHRMPLQEAVHGYRIFAGKLEGCTKVVLEP